MLIRMDGLTLWMSINQFDESFSVMKGYVDFAY